MAQTAAKSGKSGKIVSIVLVLLALAALIWKGDDLPALFNQNPTIDFVDTAGTVAVHFIDVGQGSSTLIQSGEDGILIDAGEREYAETVISYIKNSGVKTLSYVIATHPHSDHIGAMADVLKEIPAKTIIMPHLTKINTPTTKTYEHLLKTVKSKKIHSIEAQYGKTYGIDHAELTILGPVAQNENLNDMSVVCRLTAFSTSFMLLADANKSELSSILQRDPVLKSDVVLMGHHGSSKALLYSFLNRVKPDIAVISCGVNNDYGHPHRETLQYLREKKIKDYRTDLQSHIVFICSESGYLIQTAA